jgi:hypothetical protein
VVAVLGSGAIEALVYQRWSRWALHGGAGGRLGVARLRGRPSDDTVTGLQFVAVWGGPILSSLLAFEVIEHLNLAARVELGVTIAGVEGTAEDETVLSLDGPWMSGGLELAAAF